MMISMIKNNWAKQYSRKQLFFETWMCCGYININSYFSLLLFIVTPVERQFLINLYYVKFLFW